MKQIFSLRLFLQLFIFLFVNALFIFKYVPRLDGFSPALLFVIYSTFVILFVFFYKRITKNFSENLLKFFYWGIIIFSIVFILLALIKIDPYSLRVDRWSAVSFFIENLLRGDYPYAAHTHASETNFPSPFPFWYVIYFPFYLLGDVGIGLVFFLVFVSISVYLFFKSYQKSLFFIFLLILSPAYWWEVLVRSDSLNNAFLVFIFLLWVHRKNFTLNKNLLLLAVICGICASTRFSAILPLALFFFRPFIEISFKQKILFIGIILGVVILSFLPFVFWDTTSWIFFSRNPFMSQTDPGNVFQLFIMLVLGCILGYYWKDIYSFFNITSLFIFLFMLSSQVTLILMDGDTFENFTEKLYDVSYFTLLLPYCIAFIAGKVLTTNVNQNN